MRGVAYRATGAGVPRLSSVFLGCSGIGRRAAYRVLRVLLPDSRLAGLPAHLTSRRFSMPGGRCVHRRWMYPLARRNVCLLSYSELFWDWVGGLSCLAGFLTASDRHPDLSVHVGRGGLCSRGTSPAMPECLGFPAFPRVQGCFGSGRWCLSVLPHSNIPTCRYVACRGGIYVRGVCP